jgi:hypothetical protein
MNIGTLLFVWLLFTSFIIFPHFWKVQAYFGKCSLSVSSWFRYISCKYHAALKIPDNLCLLNSLLLSILITDIFRFILSFVLCFFFVLLLPCSFFLFLALLWISLSIFFLSTGLEDTYFVHVLFMATFEIVKMYTQHSVKLINIFTILPNNMKP